MQPIYLLTFYLQTGARRSEILPPKFTWVNVDTNERQIVLIGKRNKRRALPLSDLLLEILSRRGYYSHPFDYTGDQVRHKIVEKYYKWAGIKDANIHTLRKTCGALLIQNGVDIYRVSKWLGHSTVTVTERHYVDLLKRDYEDIALIADNTVGRYAKGFSQESREKLVPYTCQISPPKPVFQNA
ncbi:MAG TPA: site-specific integrase [Candidatus Marinimicrobia bacterium]|nr:site-specific integrase [Candidatus Neomarinimicrobiota bacterium]HIB72263.1 site-specific integrase [Candidatus Neomarinimicrobiota bacterium]HIB95163.1 site-specific integrase [Candidatus Neomarinimicrobiota bacterium]HIN62408.1 site-specific integrase [Candidatus Neomarinimicrobiota bacterium]HIO74204.1 site-specific integrase [Candidatus Neomarinimicrobiota bacterium]